MGRRKKEFVCDRDCLNCIHPDCILDEGPDMAEYRALARMERDLFRSDAQKKAAAYKKAYYEANREKLVAYQKAYYEENREKVAAYKKAYYEANREKVAAQQKAYYEANREKIFAQRKAFREAKHKALETLEKPDAAD